MRKDYFLSKLFNINYKIATHEGDANRRLASKLPEILFQLCPYEDVVTDKYRKAFRGLINKVKATLDDSQGRLPVKLIRCHNSTAAKYIKLLLDIYYDLEA